MMCYVSVVSILLVESIFITFSPGSDVSVLRQNFSCLQATSGTGAVDYAVGQQHY